jgi:hypothetical protein
MDPLSLISNCLTFEVDPHLTGSPPALRIAGNLTRLRLRPVADRRNQHFGRTRFGGQLRRTHELASSPMISPRATFTRIAPGFMAARPPDRSAAAETYGHVQPERHETAVEAPDRYARS